MSEFNYKIMAQMQEEADRKQGLIATALEEGEEAVPEEQGVSSAIKVQYFAVLCEALVVTETGATTFRYVQTVQDPETEVVHTVSPRLTTSTVSVTPVSTAQEAHSFLRALVPSFVSSLQ